MTKSEREIIKALFGHVDRKTGKVVEPSQIPNEEGTIVGTLTRVNTRWYVAAQRLQADGIVDIFKHKDDENIRLIVPGCR